MGCHFYYNNFLFNVKKQEGGKLRQTSKLRYLEMYINIFKIYSVFPSPLKITRICKTEQIIICNEYSIGLILPESDNYVIYIYCIVQRQTIKYLLISNHFNNLVYHSYYICFVLTTSFIAAKCVYISDIDFRNLCDCDIWLGKWLSSHFQKFFFDFDSIKRSFLINEFRKTN